MRTAAAGFVLGYLVIALLIAPTLLCALGAAPSYPDGVAMVLNRSGVLEPLQRGAKQAVENPRSCHVGRGRLSEPSAASPLSLSPED